MRVTIAARQAKAAAFRAWVYSEAVKKSKIIWWTIRSTGAWVVGEGGQVNGRRNVCFGHGSLREGAEGTGQALRQCGHMLREALQRHGLHGCNKQRIAQRRYGPRFVNETVGKSVRTVATMASTSAEVFVAVRPTFMASTPSSCR